MEYLNENSLNELVALTRYVRSDNVIRSADEEHESPRPARAQEMCDHHP